MYIGQPNFLLNCEKIEEGKNVKYFATFNEPSGETIADIPIDFDCSSKYFELDFYFLTKSFSGKSNIITHTLCKYKSECINLLRNSMETVLYYEVKKQTLQRYYKVKLEKKYCS